ncbi:MAG: hypothetical protein A2X94_15975 [Bdellovibrionales bacterium GWB1_55_8]|nr:MAG: hypothetical protein A2X94_15975 [Bdellovibrionales bacterium GWB1_55_8]
MTENRRTAASTWLPFLPSRAIVMAKRPKQAVPSTQEKPCSSCGLSSNSAKAVQGNGPKNARLMLVTDVPNAQEEIEGRPLVGDAGQLLTKMIEAIGLKRDQVYITAIVKCRPADDRAPTEAETQACSQQLLEEIETVRPQVILSLGKFASQTLLKTETAISDLRGRFHSFRGARLMPTFHPGYLLRNPSSKREAWADLQLVAAELGIKISKEKL